MKWYGLVFYILTISLLLMAVIAPADATGQSLRRCDESMSSCQLDLQAAT